MKQHYMISFIVIDKRMFINNNEEKLTTLS